MPRSGEGIPGNQRMSQLPETKRPPVTTMKASLREVERRRSQRLMISVPIRVEGTDRNGVKFVENTRTILVNRQGARIYLKRMVSAGSLLDVTTTVAHRTGKFRVVGPTQPPSSEGGEWGIETNESGKSIWGIGFPPPLGDDICAALLECRRCHQVKLSQLSIVEHEVLGTSGLLARECEICERSTSWSFEEPTLALAADDAAATLLSDESLPGRPPGVNRRSHNRVGLQMPLRVRGFQDTEEFTRTENVSRGGLCFITDRDYEVGEVVLVTCPFEKNGHNIEVRGQVVRCREMQGTSRKIYGVSYERQRL